MINEACNESDLHFQFVFTSFWSIYAYDRELVFPKVLDDIIPTWLNHAMVSLSLRIDKAASGIIALIHYYYYYIIHIIIIIIIY